MSARRFSLRESEARELQKLIDAASISGAISERATREFMDNTSELRVRLDNFLAGRRSEPWR